MLSVPGSELCSLHMSPGNNYLKYPNFLGKPCSSRLTTPFGICNTSVVAIGAFALAFIDIYNPDREESSWVLHPRGFKNVGFLLAPH
jgi:hypothetical protein